MKKDNFVVASVLFVCAFGFYFYGMCPTIYWGDSGELSLAGYNLGIAHPPGYALYTMLLHIWTHSMEGISGIFGFAGAVEPVFWSNLFSVFCGALTIGLFYLLLIEVIDGDKIISAAGAVFLLFCKDIWSQCNKTEIYGLMVLLTILSLLFAVKFVKDNSLRYLYLSMFFCAISVTHHLTFIFTFAGIVAFILFSKPGLFKIPSIIIKSVLIFVFIFCSLELYLLIRANTNPEINWGNPSTFEALIYHITGRQFASFVGDTKPDIMYLAKLIWENFNAATIFMAVGVIYLLRRRLNLFILAAVSSLGIFYFLYTYRIEGSEVNFVSFIPFGIMLTAAGFKSVSESLANRTQKAGYAAALTFFSIALLQAFLYFNHNSLRGDYQVKDYIDNIVRYIDKDDVIISQNDSDQYLQKYGYNNIIYPYMLTLKWYREKLIRLMPELDFIRSAFGGIMEKKYVTGEVWKIINALREKHSVIIMNDKKTFIFIENSPEALATTGLFYYLADQKTHNMPLNLNYRFTEISRFRVAGLDKVYSAVHALNSSYYVKIGDLDAAKKEIESAYVLNKDLKIKAYAAKVYVWLGNMEFVKKNFAAAIDYYKEALVFTPEDEGILKNIGIAEKKLIPKP